ncbi:uncharacterized protein LOC129114357 [Anoplopoma fimbria]|uniref:uncharacterized protein LOC129114357 n=1 Tax=Anoplopoma fimbria TaxID=229290 RepID=UPI0023EBBCC0|nr:uncharacterized protein LOC129114357 [Anoplopoma fimbria]
MNVKMIVTLITLSVLQFAEGASRAVCPIPETVVEEGDNVTLPCHLDPAADVVRNAVDWKRVDLGGQVVYSYRHRKQNQADQMVGYRTRTTLDHEELQRGNLSLQIYRVNLFDSGQYRCFVSKLDLSCDTNLTVVPKDQQNPTKTHDSSTTDPPESEDHDAAKNEGVLKTHRIVGAAAAAAAAAAVVAVVLCILWKRGVFKICKKKTLTNGFEMEKLNTQQTDGDEDPHSAAEAFIELVVHDENHSSGKNIQ